MDDMYDWDENDPDGNADKLLELTESYVKESSVLRVALELLVNVNHSIESFDDPKRERKETAGITKAMARMALDAHMKMAWDNAEFAITYASEGDKSQQGDLLSFLVRFMYLMKHEDEMGLASLNEAVKEYFANNIPVNDDDDADFS